MLTPSVGRAHSDKCLVAGRKNPIDSTVYQGEHATQHPAFGVYI